MWKIKILLFFLTYIFSLAILLSFSFDDFLHGIFVFFKKSELVAYTDLVKFFICSLFSGLFAQLALVNFRKERSLVIYFHKNSYDFLKFNFRILIYGLMFYFGVILFIEKISNITNPSYLDYGYSLCASLIFSGFSIIINDFIFYLYNKLFR